MRGNRARASMLGFCLLAMVIVAGLGAPTASANHGTNTERVSVSSAELQADDHTHAGTSVSFDGRYIAFQSAAQNLVSPPTPPGEVNVFVRDIVAGTTRLVSVVSFAPDISSNGRIVVFTSAADNLVPGDTNGVYDIFAHDLQTGTTERVSVSSSEAQANHDGTGTVSTAAVSADGRYVTFAMKASNLSTGDTNGLEDVFVRDRLAGTTERVSVSSSGGVGNGYSLVADISDDGRFVAFVSTASNLIASDTNGTLSDIFLRDRQTGTTEVVSLTSTGGQPPVHTSSEVAISPDGRSVAFQSSHAFVPGDTNGGPDVYVRQGGVTEQISVSSTEEPSNANASLCCAMAMSFSFDGRFIAFESLATNLVAGDTNLKNDVFVRDRVLGLTERVSLSSTEGQANGHSSGPAMSGTAGYVAFMSAASNLVPDDTNAKQDGFVRARDICRSGNPEDGPLSSFAHALLPTVRDVSCLLTDIGL